MKQARRHALRLALYLDCAGASPVLVGSSYRMYCRSLSRQLASLPLELRRQGRTAGRKRIREEGGLQRAAGHLVPIPAPGPARRTKEEHHS